MREQKIQIDSMVLFYPGDEAGEWVAHSLNFDLVGMGPDPHEAFKELISNLEVYIQEWLALGDEAGPIDPAPERFWQAANEAERLPDVRLGEIRRWLDERPGPVRGIERVRVPQVSRAAIIRRRELAPTF